jgi:release factor glutamine methyltransferase
MSQPAPKTVRFVLGATTKLLAERDFPSARLDAELLLAHALGSTRIALYTDHDKPLSEPELERYRVLVRRRLKHEPVAYLLGKKEFCEIELAVDARVLVPRPETEHLVEQALALCEGREGLVVADVATGSGAVAIALARSLGARARVIATDVSADALAVAAASAASAGVAVELREGDLAAPLAGLPPLDLVTANLPYLTSAEMSARDPSVRHEPTLALDGGPDGLALVRRLAVEVRPLLVAGGALVLEIGSAQGGAAQDVLTEAGYTGVRLVRDLAGLARVVSGQQGQ